MHIVDSCVIFVIPGSGRVVDLVGMDVGVDSVVFLFLDQGSRLGTLFGCNLAAFVRLAHSMACCFPSWCNSVACVEPCSLQGSLLPAVQSTTDVVTILGNGNMMETSGVFADIEYASGLRVFRRAQHVRETPQCGAE